jgi:hypothetical protein
LKDYNTVALIILSLFISAAFSSAGDSYSQLYNPHGVKILSPTKEQEVPINIQNFTVEGVSTDNSTNNCDVSLLLNGITPYVKVSSKGQNGPDDFSAWERIFSSNLHLNIGENKLTAKLLCSDDKSNQITKYNSVNFTGTNETTSTPITTVLNSPATREGIFPTNTTEIDESESISSENETTSTPITTVLNSPAAREGIFPTNTTEIDESESTLSDLDDQAEFMSRDQVVRNITSGPVIIPAAESQESTLFDSSPANDSVIIPNATTSGSTSDNATTPSIVIPPAESQESTLFDSSPANDSVIIPNATTSGSTPGNRTSPTVLIPSSENGSSATPLAPFNNQSFSPADRASNEISEQTDAAGEKNDDIPLILPTPSPRVTFDDSRDDSTVDSSVQDLSPVIKVENNNTEVEEGLLIVLNATQSYSNNGPIVSNAWKQLTSHQLEYIEGLNKPILKFRAPSVSQDTSLDFEISVSDSSGRSSKGAVHVLVSDDTSLGSSTSSNILNQTASELHSGDVSSNVNIPDSSEPNFIGSPSASNATALQSENQTQTTGVVTSPSRGEENSTTIKATAGVDQIVNEGMEVILNGDSTSANNSQLSHEWRQVGGDVKVSLGQQNAKQISFQAPAVDKDSKLVFRFIASADGIQKSSDEVNVTINDIPQNLEKSESRDSQDGETGEKDDDDDDDDN